MLINFLKSFLTLKLTHIQEVMPVNILQDKLNSTLTRQESNQKQTVFFSPTLIQFSFHRKKKNISSDLNSKLLLCHILQQVSKTFFVDLPLIKLPYEK